MELSCKYREWNPNPSPSPLIRSLEIATRRPIYMWLFWAPGYKPSFTCSCFANATSLTEPVEVPEQYISICVVKCHQETVPPRNVQTQATCLNLYLQVCQLLSVNLLQGPTGWCSTMGPTTWTTKTCTGGGDEKVSVQNCVETRTEYMQMRSKCVPCAYKCDQTHTEYTQLCWNAHEVLSTAFKRTLSAFKRLQTRIECIETLSNVREWM